MKQNQLKKAAALCICTALVLSFAACGKDSKKDTDSAKAENADTVKDGQEDGEGKVSIIAFNDTDDEDNNHDSDTVTTTTTTNTSKTKKTTTAKTTTTKKTTTTEKETTTTAKATTTTTAAAVKRDNSYKVSAKKYTSDDGNITYTYPQISGLYDEEMQSFYNNLFQSDMNAAVKESGLSTLNVTYEVTLKNADTLSIVFRGGSFYDGAAHPFGFAYAYTINLATGETVNPADSINMNKAADAIANDSWKLVRSADGVSKSNIVEYFNQFSEDEMKAYMTVKDTITVRKNAKGQYSTTGTVGCNSYLNAEEKPVLILEVNHALGDYVEVKF